MFFAVFGLWGPPEGPRTVKQRLRARNRSRGKGRDLHGPRIEKKHDIGCLGMHFRRLGERFCGRRQAVDMDRFGPRGPRIYPCPHTPDDAFFSQRGPPGCPDNLPIGPVFRPDSLFDGPSPGAGRRGWHGGRLGTLSGLSWPSWLRLLPSLGLFEDVGKGGGRLERRAHLDAARRGF